MPLSMNSDFMGGAASGGFERSDSMSRTRTSPIPVNRSNRRLPITGLTSLPAGRMVPIAAFGLLREDRISTSRLRVSFESMETEELLVNAINVNVKAYLVPKLAFERFNGIDQLNRSYMKVPETDGGAVVPYIESMSFDAATMPIWTYMGKHAKQGQQVATDYVEAYNTIWNFRARNRSPDLTLRAKLDKTLAPAFWQHSQFASIVPDFDQALIDGEVALNVVNSKMPVMGMGFSGTAVTTAAVATTQRESDGNTHSYPGAYLIKDGGATLASGNEKLSVKQHATKGGYPDIWAELQDNGITVSLSNIEMARKTQAFAALRKQYTGHTDDYIIDLLMNGITVPEQDWRQPILLADKTTVFGLAKRYASDSVDLTASVTNGATFVDLMITSPVCPTGGVVMIVAEILPEQLWERQMDPYGHILDQEEFPEFLRDTLDPEKVTVVANSYIDVTHATGAGVFGYAPMNFHWNALGPMIGGKFYQNDAAAPFDEDRMRIWAVEVANPTLSADFYISTNIHTKPFVVTNQDPFEATIRGLVQINGNTVFGHALIEASDDYNAVMEDVPMDRIDKV